MIHRHIGLALLVTLLLGAIGDAAPVAFIDVNDARGVPPAPDANGNYWNAITSGNLGTNVALTSTSNVSTGWTVNWSLQGSGGAGLSGGLDNPIPAPAPFDVQQAYADSWYDNARGAGYAEVTFSGLDSSLPYRLSFWGARPSSGVPGTVTVTEGAAAGGPVLHLPQASLRALEILPSTSGDITFTFDKGIAGGSSTGTADISLMSLEQIPQFTYGLAYDYNAADNAGAASGTWQNAVAGTTPQRTWDFIGGSSATPVLASHGANLAYWAHHFGPNGDIPAGAYTGSFGNSAIGGSGTSAPDATFEFWIKPSDFTSNQIIFETGGATNGAVLALEGDTLRWNLRRNNNDLLVSSALPSESLGDFLHVVGTVRNDWDVVEGERFIRLYVNGSLMDSLDTASDWTFGTDPAGLGTINSEVARYGDFLDFDGFIARARFYNRAATGAEVAGFYGEFLAAAIPEPGTGLLLLAALACGMLVRRRR